MWTPRWRTRTRTSSCAHRSLSRTAAWSTLPTWGARSQPLVALLENPGGTVLRDEHLALGGVLDVLEGAPRVVGRHLAHLRGHRPQRRPAGRGNFRRRT